MSLSKTASIRSIKAKEKHLRNHLETIKEMAEICEKSGYDEMIDNLPHDCKIHTDLYLINIHKKFVGNIDRTLLDDLEIAMVKLENVVTRQLSAN